MNDKDFYKRIKSLSEITYFGISMISPLILCLWAAVWLKNKFNLGNAVMIIAIILGIGGGVVNFYDFYKRMKKEAEEKD